MTAPDYQQRARAFIGLDTRQQTAYGTLRAYMNIGWTDDFPNGQAAGVTSAAGVYANRAFIQLAGFTWGVATSYFDFVSTPATSFTVPWSSDTGDGGRNVAAYTAQLGNGVSASFSVEEPRPPGRREQLVRQPVYRRRVADSGYRQDCVAGPRRQHSRRPGLGFRTAHRCGPSGLRWLLRHDLDRCHPGRSPGDKVGFAIGAGVKINFPMIGPGDYFQGQVNYTEGAMRYAALTPSGSGSPTVFGAGQTLGAGFFSDSNYCGVSSGSAATATCPAGGSSQQLTTAWGVDAAYEHFWTPALRTSLVGAYTHIGYNSTASTQMCGSFAGGATAGAVTGGVGRPLTPAAVRVRSTGATTASLPVPSGTSPRTSTSVWKATTAI